MTLQIQVYNPFGTTLQDIVSQEKIKNRNDNLQDRKIRRVCSDHQNELAYLWNSDPDRKGKDVYDYEEVDVLNQKYELEAVRRVMRENALISVKTGKYVDWSDFEGKWIDSE